MLSTPFVAAFHFIIKEFKKQINGAEDVILQRECLDFTFLACSGPEKIVLYYICY